MSGSRRVSATTSLPKPGALEPAWLGRSIAAISGWAELPAPAAASRLDFAMGHYSLAVGKNPGRSNPITASDATLGVSCAGRGRSITCRLGDGTFAVPVAAPQALRRRGLA